MLCAVLCAARTAAAAPNDAVHVVTEQPALCLDREAFERALFARITRPRGSGGSREAQVVVRVEPDGERFAGRVTITEPGEEPRARVVRGASCADVAHSVVLVASLALGGEPDADPDRVMISEPADDALAARAAPPPLPPAPPSWIPAAGAHLGIAAAGAGEASLAGDVFGELATRRSGFSLGLRAALGYGSAERSQGGFAMRVSTLTARLEPSLVRLAAGPLDTRLGLVLEGGAAFASASGAPRTESATRPWLRAGAQVAVAFDLLGPVAVEASGGALLALVRDDFVVEPTGFGLGVPLLAPFGRFGIIVRFR